MSQMYIKSDGAPTFWSSSRRWGPPRRSMSRP